MMGRTIEARGLSEGWLAACDALLKVRGGTANHLVVRIEQPLPEDPAIRERVDGLLAAGRHQPVDEVRNTIFPAALAEDYADDPQGLIDEYLEDYEILQRLGSPQGTYFGRICKYPHPDETHTDQLAKVINKLRESHTGTHWRAVYQFNIYAEHLDWKKKRGYFPCMSHLSFQLGLGPDGSADQLDCLAIYRYQDLIQKGYGNYIGIAELQRYVAQVTGFAPGELTVVAGHAKLTLNAATRRHLEGALTARAASR